MASKFCVKQVGRNVNMTLSIPAEKLAAVLIAIGEALGGRRGAPIQQKSTARTRRNQRRKTVQRDNQVVHQSQKLVVLEPVATTPGKTTQEVTTTQLANVVKQPCGDSKRCISALQKNSQVHCTASASSLKTPNRPTAKSAAISAIPAGKLEEPSVRSKSPVSTAQLPQRRQVNPVTVQRTPIRVDENGTLIGVDPEFMKQPPHLPGVTVQTLREYLAVKCHHHVGSSTVPSWMWSKEPDHAKRMADSISKERVGVEFKTLCLNALKERERFKTQNSGSRPRDK
jgi:hypothetical protein